MPEIKIQIKDNKIFRLKNNQEYSLNNRRYLWNKFKLLDFISEVIEKENITFSSFCDIFAWTWVVWNFFNKKNIKVISNDILEANFVSLVTFLKSTQKDFEKIHEYIEHLNNLKTTKKIIMFQ